MLPRGLLRPTPVSNRFLRFYLPIHIYTYYFLKKKKKTSDLWCCLGRMMTKEGFQASLKCFNTTLNPQTALLTHDLIFHYVCVYVLILTVFSTSRCSKLGTLIFYFVYLTEYVLYSFPSLPFFKLGVSQLCYHFCSSVLWWTCPSLTSL